MNSLRVVFLILLAYASSSLGADMTEPTINTLSNCQKWVSMPMNKESWNTIYDGGGQSQWSDGLMFSPQVALKASDTHAALFLAKDFSSRDFLIRVQYENKESFRKPAANSWEVFWLFFN